jgi:hypothetical protein
MRSGRSGFSAKKQIQRADSNVMDFSDRKTCLRLSEAPSPIWNDAEGGMRFKISTMAALLVLSSCGSRDVGLFANGQPSMSPADWMVGTVDGYGLIIDRFGTVKSQFHAHEVGTWDAASRTVTLVEHITYLQGSADAPTDRTWRFVESTPGHWTGTAADVIGTAVGEQQGNAWHLVFQQLLPVGGHQIEASVDDWRWREADNVAVDSSVISKAGLTLATAQIAFVKAASTDAQR